MSEAQKVGINWVQVMSAALAAVSSAVLLSTLGVAGTLIGAAVGSMCASIGSALYSRGIAASRHRVAAQAAALRRAAQARTQGPEGTSVMTPVLDPHVDPADAPTEEALIADGAGAVPPEEVEEPELDALYHAEPGKPLPWKRVTLVAAALFVVVLVAITAFELVTGKPVSAYTGGSQGSGTTLFNDGKDKTKTPGPSESPSDEGTSGTTPEESPSEAPSISPSGSATPTDLPSETPSVGSTPGEGSTTPDTTQ